MTKIRLLPLVLIAVVALLAVKVLGLVMGVEPFPVGPLPAAASGGAEASHGEVAGEATPSADTSAVDRLTAPVDLAREFQKLKEEQEKGAHGAAGGHGETAPADAHAAPAADAAHGEAAPADAHAAPAADAAHGEAAPADAHAAPAADAAHGEAAPADAHAAPAADAAHGEAAPADAHAAPAAEAAHGEAAPAADAHAAPAADAHGAPASDAHGGAPATGAYTERPKEYSPPIGSSETAILEGLAVRRDTLDKRENDLDLRAKLLEAAEKRIEERLQQLQSIESQLGGADPAAAAGAPAQGAAVGTPAAGPAAGAAKAAAANDQITALVSLYESMKPKAAAAVFDKLPAPTLIELASRMNPRKLSPIMAAMNPDIAGRVTAMLIGAQQAQKKVVVQVEQVAPEGLLMPVEGNAASTLPAELPQIMPAEAPAR